MSARDYILLYINGKRHEVRSEDAFMPLSDYLRYHECLTGTKVVCAEGDCGACTVLVTRVIKSNKNFQLEAMNSCISALYLLDGCHIVTVEGLQDKDNLHPVQSAMIENFGAQCGYCTPGFVCAMAQLAEDALEYKFEITEKKARNYLTGNLCRCTGYKGILEAACKMNLENYNSLKSRYNNTEIINELKTAIQQTVIISAKSKKIFIPSNLQEAIQFKKEQSGIRLNSGGTDIGVLINKGRFVQTDMMSLNNIKELYEIEVRSDSIKVGARASLSDLESIADKYFPEFGRKLHIFASPQIKNKATLVGNVANASPIGDSIPFLMVADTQVVLLSEEGETKVKLNDFYIGYKKLKMNDDEFISYLEIPKTKHNFKLYKVSIRKDLDISAVTFAAKYEIENNKIKSLSIAVGGVAATVIRMTDIENQLIGKEFKRANFENAAEQLAASIHPLSDVRGSSDYRKLVARNLMLKFFDEVNSEMGNPLCEVVL